MTAQDRLRSEKKGEVARVSQSFVAFDGKRTGWDVSIVEDEFAHHTGEAMLERWENSNGKNQRRFFFFHDGKLYKMFVSLDVSILPEDKKNFETFAKVMQGQYGAGDVEPGVVTWRTDEFHVRAVDKLRTYDALGLVIEDPREKKALVALREAKAPPKKETNAVIKSVIDTDDSDHPNIKQNMGAIDAVIKAQEGGGPAPPEEEVTPRSRRPPAAPPSRWWVPPRQRAAVSSAARRASKQRAATGHALRATSAVAAPAVPRKSCYWRGAGPPKGRLASPTPRGAPRARRAPASS